MTCEVYEVLNKVITFTDASVFVCNSKEEQIASLTRKGLNFSNLFSKFLYLFLSSFFQPQIRAHPKLTCTFDLEDKAGRLHFNWQYFVRQRSLTDVPTQSDQIESNFREFEPNRRYQAQL